jgi:acetylxylan esterase
MHYCTGTASAYFKQNKLPSLADNHGYILIYPQATHDNNCFDAATNATLSHNGGSDSLSIVNMVKYTITKYNADPARVFATGSSSGAIMTNVLCGAYPDVFAAGAAFSGMPFGCLAGSPGSSPTSADPDCANGKHVYAATKWGDMVRGAYPGYNGSYPRMQLWHGTTDNVIYYQDLVEEVKEWSNVLRVSWTKNETDVPKKGYTRMVFGDGTKMVAYSAAGVGHFVPTDEGSVLSWFGITS